MIELPFRQIHLDFHTSEHIEGIGADFDAEEFAATLEAARVDSITCFARCHHGWLYYYSEKFPEMQHPHLKCDLLREQIEACHKRNIRVPIYTTVQWDYTIANRHPEWLCTDAQGRISGTPPFAPGFYRSLDVTTPYVDYLKAHIDEVMRLLPTDGLFLDIVQPKESTSQAMQKAMEADGYDPANPEHRQLYGLEAINNFKRDMTAFIHERNPACSIFYNAGHVGPRHRPVLDAYTHFELESLPSGGWGYLHFPITARYARTLPLDVMSMTGKFHTSWGDFQSYKNIQALEYECFNMLALGAKCGIGDQLHPSGVLCKHTYELVGEVYTQVEAKEPWCKDVKPVVDIGVFSPEAFIPAIGHAQLPDETMGVVQMLQEPSTPLPGVEQGQALHQFDLIDAETDFSAYKVLVMPDSTPVSGELAEKLKGYLDQGGSILASYKGGLTPDGNKFALDAFGIECKGDAPYSPDFLLPREVLADGFSETEYVMYDQGMEVTPRPGTEVLADVNVPYFNRTWRHFCSHRHTPSAQQQAAYPGATRCGKVVYLMHPVFRTYQNVAPQWYKRLVHNALELLLPEPALRIECPTTVRAAINAQESENRWVVHLLHYIPERRCKSFDIIEDTIPLYDLPVSVRADRKVKRVATAPEGHELEFVEFEGRAVFTLPVLSGHQMVAVEFA